jgi:hypothetical protein
MVNMPHTSPAKCCAPSIESLRTCARGYGALTFAYADDGNFKHARWVYRLTSLHVDRPLAPQEHEEFGNILFYPAGDASLLIRLQMLLDSCDHPYLAGGTIAGNDTTT